jgi:hypothetical protein
MCCLCTFAVFSGISPLLSFFLILLSLQSGPDLSFLRITVFDSCRNDAETHNTHFSVMKRFYLGRGQ